MISRDEIRRIPDLYRQIQRDKEQLRYLREKSTSVGSTTLENERVQTSPANEGMRFVNIAVDLERTIEAEELELVRLQTEARKLIDTLDDPLQVKVMQGRYLMCYSWDQIATMLGYSMRHVARIEHEVLSEMSYDVI